MGSGADVATERADVATERADVAAESADVAADGADVAADGADMAADGADMAADGADMAADGADMAADGADMAPERADMAPPASAPSGRRPGRLVAAWSVCEDSVALRDMPLALVAELGPVDVSLIELAKKATKAGSRGVVLTNDNTLIRYCRRQEVSAELVTDELERFRPGV